MTREEYIENYKVSVYAHRYWNFGKIPPDKYKPLVAEYIRKHPEEFKGLTPQ